MLYLLSLPQIKVDSPILIRKYTMIKQIEQLETISRQLEVAPEQRALWNQKVVQHADDFLDQIEDLNGYDQPKNADQIPEYSPFQEEAENMDALLSLIRKKVNRQGINPASGKHLGYVPGGGLFPAALGDYIAAVTNRYSGIYFANPGAVQMENYCIRWMCELAGYPSSALGNLASGGSVATLTAITTARSTKGIKARDIENCVIYLTEQVHHCLHKALRIAGMEEAQLQYIPMDEQFRMQANVLEKQVKADQEKGLIPFLLVGSAGTTDTGAIDPLDELADISATFDLWFHVDAAYGGFFLMLDDVRKAFKGIERSDSITIDPHKGLFLPYGLGAVLIKDVKAQYQAHYYKANYMQDALPDNEEWSPADLSPELTKHFRGLRMWLPLKLYGLKPFRAALQEKILLCQYFYEKVQEMGFEVGPFPQLSILIYRYRPEGQDINAFNEQLVKYVKNDGRVFLSSTKIEGAYWIRLAVVSFRTHLKEINLCLKILREGLERLHLNKVQDYNNFT